MVHWWLRSLLGVAMTWSGALLAQDLVVRINGDSVNCRIRGTDTHGIHYVHLYEGKLDRVYLRNEEVDFWRRGHFAESFREGRTLRELRGFPYFRVALAGGVGRLRGKIDGATPDWFQEHQRQLRHGWFMAGEALYRPSEHLGVGVLFNMMAYGATSRGVPFTDGSPTIIYGTLKNDVLVTFVGPSVAYMVTSPSGKWTSAVSFSIGRMTFRDDAVYATPVHLTGSTFGLRIGGSLEYKLGGRFSAGVNLAGLQAGLSRLVADEDPVGYDLLGYDRIALSRWEGGLCLSYTY